MNSLKLTVVGASLALVVGLGAVASAQAPAAGQGQGRGQGRGQRGQGQFSLAAMSVDQIDKALKLTAEQKTKITTIHDKFAADTKALAPAAGERPDPANRQKRTELTRAANTEITALLTEDQKKKVDELRAESVVLTAAGAPRGMAGELKWTDEQKKKIAALTKEAQENRTKLQGLSPEEARTKRAEITKATQEKVQALLTDEQKAQIDKYKKDHPQAAGRGANRRQPPPP